MTNELVVGYTSDMAHRIEDLLKLNTELTKAAKLAQVELELIYQAPFDPDRFQERINALDALSRAVRKAGDA